MSQGWNSLATTKLKTGAAQDYAVAAGKLKTGVEQARTRSAGTATPASTAVDAYDGTDVGELYLDISTPADTAEYAYQQKTAAGPTRGYRRMQQEIVRYIDPDAPEALANTSSAVDVAWTDLDCSTPVDAIQAASDSQFTETLVKAILIRVKVRCTGAEPPAGGDVGIAFRLNGSAGTGRRVRCQKVGVWVEQDVKVYLDSVQKCEYTVDTNAAAVTVEWILDVREIYEHR